jgi:hypothetical protein
MLGNPRLPSRDDIKSAMTKIVTALGISNIRLDY